eukprot:TRINITY_DN8558_c1_g1_i2.p1 TRINITY_DN8558_c1_g1~~TRINITY_DN8558_c1_g1_i2.p1  ORF type:complete len:103 (+),score=2.13 TRINITY_DN8558_c1_g1_i2:190-498(+)
MTSGHRTFRGQPAVSVAANDNGKNQNTTTTQVLAKVDGRLAGYEQERIMSRVTASADPLWTYTALGWRGSAFQIGKTGSSLAGRYPAPLHLKVHLWYQFKQK